MQTRYLSLDVMRGATLALMIIVNMSLSAEAAFSQLLHAVWHGFTLTDAVFPTFLFCVGASMAINFEKFQLMDSKTFWLKTLKRSALIFLCGFIVSNFPFVRLIEGSITLISPDNWRILGVLQRIALCFLLAMALLRYAGLRAAIVVCAVILIANWLLFTTFGDLSLENNIARKIDYALLGANHLYKGEGIPFDPEGIVGTLPSMINIIGGFTATYYLRGAKDLPKTLRSIALAGAAMILMAVLWNNYFPINKKIWTSSYVILMIGIDSIVLSTLAFLIDFKGFKRGTDFFAVFGKNTLFLYFFAEILMGVFWSLKIGESEIMFWLYDNIFAGIPGKFGNFAYAIIFMLGVWSVGLWLDRKKIYIRV